MRYFIFYYYYIIGNGKQEGHGNYWMASETFPSADFVFDKVKADVLKEGDPQLALTGWNEFASEEDYNHFRGISTPSDPLETAPEPRSPLYKYATELKDTLQRLVSLKRLKDEKGKTEYYMKNQPQAWKQAIDLLGEEDAEK